MEVLTLRKYWVEADCWKEMPTHSTRSAVAMSSSMRSYTVSGVMTWSAAYSTSRQNDVCDMEHLADY